MFMNDVLKIKQKNCGGYSLVELVMSAFIGSVVLAGAYASYSVVAAQYQRSSGKATIRDFAIPTINILSRDLRMSGYRAVDDNIESVFPKIDIPVSITDVANNCCDSFYVTYDKDENNRVRVTYFVSPRTNPDRNALFTHIDSWNGSGWDRVTDSAIVADYIEDFQIEALNNNQTGLPTLVNFNLVFKSRNKNATPITFTKSEHGSGNNPGWLVTDNYLREEFDTSVILRNLLD